MVEFISRVRAIATDGARVVCAVEYGVTVVAVVEVIVAVTWVVVLVVRDVIGCNIQHSSSVPAYCISTAVFNALTTSEH